MSQTTTKKANILFLWVFILTYISYFGLISIMKFNSFAYYDFDLAVHDLSIWNILHGSIFNSILGIPFLGNHVHLILFLICPIYAIFNHPLTLLLLQTLALGLGALPLYKLSKKLLDENWALIISIIYLLYPALGHINLFEFHPTVFATLFLLMSVYYYETDVFFRFIIIIFLSMLCQENIPLTVIMFGVMAIFERRKLKWILVPIILGCLYFWVALSFIAYFNNNTIQFISLYRHLGNSPVNILLNIVEKPSLLWKSLARKECFTYFNHIFIPLFFLPLLSPLKLLPALPFFLQHMLSNRPSDLSIYYHYTAELIPFIFVSFLYAIRFLLKIKKIRLKFLPISLLFVAISSSIFFGPRFMIFSRLFNEYQKDYLDVYKDKFLSKIPKEASVVATFEFLSHLTHRQNLYSLHHQYTGLYTLSNKRYTLPDDVEYALIDFNDFLTFKVFYGLYNYKNLQDFLLKGNWKILDLVDTIALLKKNTRQGFELCKPIEKHLLAIQNKTQIPVEDSIELTGYDLKESREGLLDITFYWKCLAPTQKDINIFLDIVDENDRLVMRKIRPICYRIFPTNSWQDGQILKEECRVLIPSGCLKEGFKIKIGFFDFWNSRIYKINAVTDNQGRKLLTEIK